MDPCQFFFNVLKYFISLGLKARTTSYSCSEDDEDYGENFLLRRPLPWVVRVYFQYKNSLKGSLCSGWTWTYISFKSHAINCGPTICDGSSSGH